MAGAWGPARVEIRPAACDLSAPGRTGRVRSRGPASVRPLRVVAPADAPRVTAVGSAAFSVTSARTRLAQGAAAGKGGGADPSVGDRTMRPEHGVAAKERA